MAITDAQIEAAALRAKKVQGDEGMIEEKPISEMLLAADRIAANAAIQPPFGLRIAKCKPGPSI